MASMYFRLKEFLASTEISKRHIYVPQLDVLLQNCNQYSAEPGVAFANSTVATDETSITYKKKPQTNKQQQQRNQQRTTHKNEVYCIPGLGFESILHSMI